MYNVHRFSYELRPAMLDDLGLVIALRWHVKSFAKRTGIKIHFNATSAVEQLESEAKIVIYRVIQESLTNVYKYARANRADVTVRKVAAGIRLMVKDNGRGFRPNQLDARSKDKSGLGVVGMRERLRLVNGEFIIESTPGKGTTVRATLPFQPGEQPIRSTPKPRIDVCKK